MSSNTKTATTADATHERLMKVGRDGSRRIETLGWGELGRLYRQAAAASLTRKAIAAECRRLGYTPSVVLGLNR